MEIVVGAPVTGENLHGREGELDELWSRIRNNSILLASPRRFGKTSLVKEMERAPRDGFEVVYLEVEGINRVQDFVSSLAEALSKPAQQTLLQKFAKSVKENIEEAGLAQIYLKFRAGVDKDWAEDGSKVFEMLQNSEKKHIIVIDELPSFLLNLEASEDQNQSMGMFLRWLRQMRQTHDARFILCGSVGIDSILRRHSLSNTVNDLERITVHPFDLDTASSMVKRLLDKSMIEYKPKHVQKILTEIGIPSPPYFVQVMLLEVCKMTDKEKAISEGTIDRAYQGVLNANGKEYFDWYYDRLKTEFSGDRLEAALSMLDHLALHESCTKSDLSRVFSNALGKEDKDAFLDVVSALESGFYITRGKECSFRVKVLRDWWSERRLE